MATMLALVLLVAPEVLLMGFAGVLLAVFLDGGSGLMSRWTGLPRLAALPLFVLLIVGGFVLVGWLAAPVVADQIDQLEEQVPRAFRSLRERLQSQVWGRALVEQFKPERLMSAGQAIAGGATTALSATFGAFGNVAIIFILGLFLAADPVTYRKGLRALFPPEERPAADHVLDELRDVLRGWLMAQLGSMAAIGVLTAVGLWALGIPLVVALGLLAAVLTFIPNWALSSPPSLPYCSPWRPTRLPRSGSCCSTSAFSSSRGT